MQSKPRTVVIGAGPAGLAVSERLTRQGHDVTILERGDTVGSSWRSHRAGLRLHTMRRLSSLPGMRIPRSSGQYVSSENVLNYLESYASRIGATIRTGVTVTAVSKIAEPSKNVGGARWRVSTASGEAFEATTLVIATGYNNTPHIPAWKGKGEYLNDLFHAADYPGARNYVGKDVLVVGAGNAAAEVALDLVAGGAKRVRMSIRTPPHFVRHRIGPFSSQSILIALSHLPLSLADRGAWIMNALTVKNLSAASVARSQPDLFTRTAVTRSVPVQDRGIVAAIRSGAVEPVAGVVGLGSTDVLLADGSSIAPAVVIAATGFRRGLGGLLGHLEADRYLDADGVPITDASLAAAPGLYFIGFTVSATGALRDIARNARKIARHEGSRSLPVSSAARTLLGGRYVASRIRAIPRPS